MRKYFLLMLSFFVVLSVPYATQARREAIQLPYWAIDDDGNVLDIPSTAAEFSDLVRFEGMYGDGPFGGIHFGFGERLKLAFYADPSHTTHMNYLFPMYPYNDTTGIPMGFYPQSIFDIIAAYDTGSLVLGFNLHLSNNHTESDGSWRDVPAGDAGDNNSYFDNTSRDLEFTFEIMLRDFAFFEKFHFLIDLGLPYYNYEDYYEVYDGTYWDAVYEETESNKALKFGVRNIGNMGAYRYFLSFNMNGMDVARDFITDDDLDDVYEDHFQADVMYDIMTFQGGLSKTFKFKGWFFSAGFYVSYLDHDFHVFNYDMINDETLEEFQATNSTLQVPVFLSAEFNLKRWLVFRAGLSVYALYRDTGSYIDNDWTANAITDTYTETTDYSSNYYPSMRLGVGFKFSGIGIDLTFYPNHLLDAYVFSGDDHYPVAEASAVFNW